VLAWHPPVGVFIAILALVGVAVPWLKEKVSKREKALWTAVMFALVLLEIRSIYKDQAEHDKQQADARAEQLKSFKEIAKGIDIAITNSQKEFNATMQRTNQVLNSTTGGTGFCSAKLAFWANQPLTAILSVSVHGDYPIYGVTVEVQDTARLSLLEAEHKDDPQFQSLILGALPRISLGDLPPHDANRLQVDSPIQLLDRDKQVLHFIFSSSRNGMWEEELRLHRIGRGWPEAVRVRRDVNGKHIVIFREVEEGFPVADIQEWKQAK
jgi:hypothetical protein